jgi:dihydrodipicolinate synthase/N-acetylneuraminate lyase
VFKGSLVALVTPFDGNNRVDFEAIKRLIDFHVEHGSDGLVIAGTTGESATLDRTEHIELISRAVEIADGRLPIIAGTGSNSTAQTVDLSRAVATTGIAAFLIVVPYYNKPVQEGLYQHFSVIADSVDKPVMMYNVPGRTVADMLPETVARLAVDFRLYSGDDFTLRPFIEQGGHGVVTVSGNVAPAQVASLCRLALAGKKDEALALDETLQALNTALFIESNPIPVKWALGEMGLIEANIRLPLTPFSGQYHDQMRAAMRQAGIALKENA